MTSVNTSITLHSLCRLTFSNCIAISNNHRQPKVTQNFNPSNHLFGTYRLPLIYMHNIRTNKQWENVFPEV